MLTFVLGALLCGPAIAQAETIDTALDFYKACADPDAEGAEISGRLAASGWVPARYDDNDIYFVMDGEWTTDELAAASYFLFSNQPNAGDRDAEIGYDRDQLRSLHLHAVDRRRRHFDPNHGNKVFRKGDALVALGDDRVMSCVFFGPETNGDMDIGLAVASSDYSFPFFRVREDAEPIFTRWQGRSDWNRPYWGAVMFFPESVLDRLLPDRLPDMIFFTLKFDNPE